MTFGSVSAVIPHYKDTVRMSRQLRALAAQTRPFDEIIVVDDASPPEDVAHLCEILDEYPNARLIRRERNGGPALASNDGLAGVTSEYVAFLASDDEVSVEFVEVSAGALDANPGVAFSFADPAFVNDAGDTNVFPLYLAKERTRFDRGDLRKVLSKTYFTFATNTNLYRTAGLKMVGGIPVPLSSFADSFMNFALAFRAGAVYVPQSLGVFHLRSDSFSHREQSDPAAVARMTQRMLDALDAPFADVADAFRAVGVLPRHDFRVLVLLIRTPKGRRYLTLRTAIRCLAFGTWHLVSSHMPTSVRRGVRWMASRLSRPSRK